MRVTLVRGRASDAAIYKVAETLAKNRYDVKLLLWDKQNIWTKEKILKNKEEKGYTIEPLHLKAPEDKWTVYFFFPLWTLYQFFYLLNDKNDVIHANDLDTLWPAILIKTLRKKKFCYTIYDFYANNLSGSCYIVSIGRKFIARLEKTGIGFTDALFLVDECRYEEVKGSKINRLAYLYNSPQDIGNKKDLSAIENKGVITIFFGGYIYEHRGFDFMLKAIEDLDRIRLLIGGVGPDVDMFNNLPEKLKGKVEYIGFIPTYKMLLELTNNSDILFRFNNPVVPNSKYGSPNKLFEAMMCGKPIIVNSEIAASRIVDEEDCGITLPYGNVNELKKAIILLRDSPELRHKLGTNGRKAYEQKYSWNIMEERLLNTYKEISQPSR